MKTDDMNLILDDYTIKFDDIYKITTHSNGNNVIGIWKVNLT